MVIHQLASFEKTINMEWVSPFNQKEIQAEDDRTKSFKKATLSFKALGTVAEKG